MEVNIVLGLQYGDECKGMMTSYLSNEDTIVVRFNGGHQAGHTVVKNGFRHAFSNVGAGTMNGADTYISEYCTIYPKALFNEKETLKKNGFPSSHFIHPFTMVTTPFDIQYNRRLELNPDTQNGSVGVGFGATVERCQTSPFKLYAIDLEYPHILKQKLYNIATIYYAKQNFSQNFIEKNIEDFLEYANLCSDFVSIEDFSFISLGEYEKVVFEGAQGVMLDMDFGYFPNVTRSNTTCKNAMTIIEENGLEEPTIYCTMRSYLTRHGKGYMPNEDSKMKFEDLTNVSHQFQGDFRFGYHSYAQLMYAYNVNSLFSKSCNTNLLISCLDQTDNKLLIDNSAIEIDKFAMNHYFNEIFINDSVNVESIRQFK